MKNLFYIFLFIPLLGAAQNQGVQFEHLSWEQLRAKAKAENKYIFVDCYASWCGTCKDMDKYVYSNDAVGETVNPRFVSMKLQMDITKNDNDDVKSHYADARNINKAYPITAYPTILLFSADGEMIYKIIGARAADEFIPLIKKALNPENQYTTLVTAYESNKTDYAKMPALAQRADDNGDGELFKTITANYYNYLNKLSLDEFATKEHIEFVGKYLTDRITSKDNIFRWFYKHGDKIDSVMHNNDGANHVLINFIINKEEIIPRVKAAEQIGAEPDWERARNVIKAKYGIDAIKMIRRQKCKWYFDHKEWQHYTETITAIVEEADINESKAWYGLNEAAWNIFLYSKQNSELEKAVKWVNRSLALKPDEVNSIDTKANLLYKLGQRQEAINLETKAATLAPKDKDIKAALGKMKKGEPTWTNY